MNISIHAPREGGDHRQHGHREAVSRFQSTPPARGATPEALKGVVSSGISIHAPREGGDIYEN